MTTPEPNTESGDAWSRWLLHERDAGDPALRQRNMVDVNQFRERVLDNARLSANQVFLDIGAGEGVLGLGAIARVGPSLRVIFSDISAPLQERLRREVTAAGLAGQCSFVLASAERLDAIAANSVDVAAARSALAYVADKPAAFAECYRVLKPGGRFCFAEPINQDHAFELAAEMEFLRHNPRHPDAELMRLNHRIRAAHYPATMEAIAGNPLTNYSERDLITILRATGFVAIHLELHIDVTGSTVSTWDAYLHASPYPGAPTPAQVMSKQFSAVEVKRFEAILRPIIESGKGFSTDLMAYAVAEKPLGEL